MTLWTTTAGACAVFAGQGSFASQMTAAKVMDVIARLPDCDGQAADAISAYTEERLEDAPRVLKIPESLNVHICGYVFHGMNGPNHGRTLGIQWFSLKEICTDTHSPDNGVKESSRKLCWISGGRKYRIGNVNLFIENEQKFFLACVDDIRMAAKNQNVASPWKK